MSKSTRRATILVVDDDGEACALMELLLQREGYHVFGAADGVEALASVGASCPDLVLTDMQMPRMNGLELRDSLRATHPGLPVVLLTGDVDVAAEEVRSGVDNCLLKPVNVEELCGLLERALGRP